MPSNSILPYLPILPPQGSSHSLPIVLSGPISPSQSNLPSHLHRLCSESSSSMWLKKMLTLLLFFKYLWSKVLFSPFHLSTSSQYSTAYLETVRTITLPSKYLFSFFIAFILLLQDFNSSYLRHPNTVQLSHTQLFSGTICLADKYYKHQGIKRHKKLFRVMKMFCILTVVIHNCIQLLHFIKPDT